MTLTNSNCPVAGSMPESVGNAISTLEEVSSIKVNLIWHPKWSKDGKFVSIDSGHRGKREFHVINVSKITKK